MFYENDQQYSAIQFSKTFRKEHARDNCIAKRLNDDGKLSQQVYR